MKTRKDRPLQVLSAASEVFPLIKTGGLADVVGALPHALAPHDIFIRTLIPGYPAVFQHLEDAEPVWRDTNFFGGDSILIRARAGGLDLFILDAPHLFARPGNPYLAPNGTDWPDNPIRFAALSYAAALLCQGIVPDYQPSILHVHDWQTGLAPAYLHVVSGPKPASIITVHNLAFQGLAPASLLETLALPAAMFAPGGVEYYGSIGALKAGLRYADRITTVSPSYAAEILTAEGGMGLHGLLQERAPDVFGILNGIDTKIWDPQTDLLIPAPYSAATLTARTRNKAALQAQFGLPQQSSTIVFGVVSRLSDQKGLDVLLACLPDLLAMDAQLVVLGAGDTSLQAAFADAAIRHPAQIGTIIGYSEPLAHLIQAGSDALLVPSRFEPCGLTQLCALRYGAIPIVSRVGGLADTIIDANEAALNAGVANGLQFNPVTQDGLAGALRRAQRLWQQPKAWAKMQKNAMATDVSWTNPAQRYADLYRSLA